MLTHKGTQTIITQRLTLRRFQVDDAQAMFDTWANDERVTRFLTWVPHESPEFTKLLLENWCASYENPNYYNWVIELEGKIIGNISVVRISEESLKNADLLLKGQNGNILRLLMVNFSIYPIMVLSDANGKSYAHLLNRKKIIFSDTKSISWQKPLQVQYFQRFLLFISLFFLVKFPVIQLR